MDQTELQPAIDYVMQNGTAVERARLRYLLYGDPPPDEAREQFERSQRGDGGWAAQWSPEYSSLDATCYRLAQADRMGIGRRSLTFIDAIRFLAERQQQDGSWEEDPTQAPVAPLWAMPGDTASRLYLTANCGFWVAVTGLVPAVARDAAVYLSFHLGENGALPSFPHTHWLATALWQRQRMTDEAAKGLACLLTQIPELSAGNLAWMLVALREGNVPVEDVTVGTALNRLIDLRDPAGHWPSDEGADNATHVTIEAIKSLQLCGQLM